jgi:hypothetical protein
VLGCPNQIDDEHCKNFGHSLLKKYKSQKASYPKILQKEKINKSTYLPVF